MYVFGRPSDSIIRCLEDYFTPVLDIKNNLYAHPQKHQTNINVISRPKIFKSTSTNQNNHHNNEHQPTKRTMAKTTIGHPQDLTISLLR